MSAAKLIKFMMLIKDVNQTDIAKVAGVSVSLVNMVIHGKKRSRKVEKTIAAILDLPADTLFK